MYEVEFYADKHGKESVRDYLVELQSKGKACKADRIKAEKIMTYIRVLQEYGTRAGEPYMKHISDSLWELRPLSDRIIFFYFKDNRFVLLHHFTKKSNKTPQREIDKAKSNMLDHIGRNKQHGN